MICGKARKKVAEKIPGNLPSPSEAELNRMAVSGKSDVTLPCHHLELA